MLGPVNKGAAVLMSGLDLERLVLSGGPLGYGASSLVGVRRGTNRSHWMFTPIGYLLSLDGHSHWTTTLIGPCCSLDEHGHWAHLG